MHALNHNNIFPFNSNINTKKHQKECSFSNANLSNVCLLCRVQFWLASIKGFFTKQLRNIKHITIGLYYGFLGSTRFKEPTHQSRRCDRHRFDPWVGKTPWRKICNPLQYSCLENPMERGIWWATVHRVPKNWTRLKQLSMYTCILSLYSIHPQITMT